MSYRIRLSPDAQREIRALPGHVRALAVRVIDSLAETPRPLRAKELRDKPNIYRIWLAGRWRLVYELEEEDKVVWILRVRSKDDIDYESV